ncbi:DNA-binding protein [Ruminococcus sp.]|uniref:DNA-binding protein n=1 Tax=Ruminococcus sp. TaxID=41978 RepID=UPI003AF7F220
MGDFLGTKAMAEKWNCRQSQISKWCREGKIQGAQQDKKGSPWRIPIDAQKPIKGVHYENR